MNQKTTSDIVLLTPLDNYFSRYLKLPYRLLTDMLDNKPEGLTTLEAFIQLLAHVRHEEVLEGYGENQQRCRRGESFQSMKTWSELFHWDRFKTRRFLLRLRDSGLIELENKVTTTRLRVIRYDYYVGRAGSPQDKPYPEDFEVFWTAFHDTTQMPGVDKVAAYKAWHKLSFDERTKAATMIPRYYYSLTKTTYCVKALTYLQNKKFNDQYLY
jgi:hypothetical protein